MAQRLKILLLIPHLGGGGAERVTEILARHLPAVRYEIHLGLITQSRTAARSEFGAQVTVHELDCKRVRTGAASLLRLVRRVHPDLILSNMAHLNFLVLLLRPLFPSPVRVIVRQNGTPSSMVASFRFPRIQRALYRQLYKRADSIICQSEAMAGDMQRVAGIERKKLAVLPNPIDTDRIRSRVRRNDAPGSDIGAHLLAVGRLSHEKGLDLLLHAFAEVRRGYPDIDLTLAGEGPQREELLRIHHDLQLEGVVHFAGQIDDLTHLFAGSTLFVLPSRHEGMPNALLEAAAAGLPLVATPASEGLVALLRGQPGVWIASDASAPAIARAILASLRALRAGQRFSHEWVRAFSIPEAIPAYCQLIEDVLGDVRQ